MIFQCTAGNSDASVDRQQTIRGIVHFEVSAVHKKYLSRLFVHNLYDKHEEMCCKEREHLKKNT